MYRPVRGATGHGRCRQRSALQRRNAAVGGMVGPSMMTGPCRGDDVYSTIATAVARWLMCVSSFPLAEHLKDLTEYSTRLLSTVLCCTVLYRSIEIIIRQMCIAAKSSAKSSANPLGTSLRARSWSNQDRIPGILPCTMVPCFP